MNEVKARAILEMDLESAMDRARAGSLARTYVVHGPNGPPLQTVIPAREGEDSASVRSLVRYLTDALSADAVSLVVPVVIQAGGRPLRSVVAAAVWRYGEGDVRASAHAFRLDFDARGNPSPADFPEPPGGLDMFLSANLDGVLSPVGPDQASVAFARARLEERDFLPPVLDARIPSDGQESPTLH